MFFPTQYCSFIIGKKGINIKKINNTSGAIVMIYPTEGNKNIRRLTILGNHT